MAVAATHGVGVDVEARRAVRSADAPRRWDGPCRLGDLKAKVIHGFVAVIRQILFQSVQRILYFVL